MKRAKDVQQAVALPHLFPQIGGAVGAPRGVGRVAGAAVQPLVEGQEMRGTAGQPRGHEHLFGIDRKVHQRPALELEQRFAVVAVLLVLGHRVRHRLPRHRVLQLGGDHWNAVDR
jgi:hypothetical protein